MRILVIGDQHFRYELPYASAFKDGRKGEWEAVKKTIQDTAKTCDAVVLIGDNFNARHNHSSVIREFVDFLKEFGDKEVHILVGNHERYGTSTALDFLKQLDVPNWHIYDQIKQDVKIGDVKATFIPYVTPALLRVETKEEAQNALADMLKPADVAFVHHAITGTKNTEFFNEIMLDQGLMIRRFGMTFGGHVHKPERLSQNVMVVGNIFTQEVGEHEKLVCVWDSNEKTWTDILLPVRGIYKVMIGEGPLAAIPEHSIVKAIVTDPMTTIDTLKEELARFDAYILIEQYPNERSKMHFEDGALDLSVESMLQKYSEAKGLVYADLKEGFELIKQ